MLNVLPDFDIDDPDITLNDLLHISPVKARDAAKSQSNVDQSEPNQLDGQDTSNANSEVVVQNKQHLDAENSERQKENIADGDWFSLDDFTYFPYVR